MDADLERRVQEAARRLATHGATAVYVFGSAVDGTLREGSDVDIAVTGLPSAVFFRAMAEAARIVGRPVDLVDLDSGDVAVQGLRRSGELRRVG